MYDDGAHNDGNSGDNVFGASFTLNEVQAQYYVYAENSTAGIFSPQRAEHEFYTLQINIQTPASGQVVINEFLANNLNDTTDENGTHSDWIELYNTTSDTLNLFGLYLSDSYTNPTKFTFPLNSLIFPHSYLIVWADDNNSSNTAIHCNFKLSLSGERLMLSDNNATVLDSISYGPQSADISTGRCPNGTGAFMIQTQTTFNGSNCPTGTKENFDTENSIFIFPNPASNQLTINISVTHSKQYLEIENSRGQIMFRQIARTKNQIDISSWACGIYFLKYGSNRKKIVVHH